ncbi:major facilitator superfamily domain-containing protein [Limtongia smithiae]|uniref:major facilitator superfamily domain-containing protein n=1 Tax=Limtongia smithiae TaxID=1125753 RepID=UPI0034CFA907
MFCTFGWVNAIGVFQDYYETHQLSAYSASSIGWIASLQAFIMFFGGVFIGKIFDFVGPHYILFFGTILHVLGLMMTSISHTYGQILGCQGIISPIGSACVFYASLSSVATHFRAKRGLATGIASSGSSLGGTLFPIIVKRLSNETSFGWMVRACAFIILGLLIIANLTITSNNQHTGWQPIKISDFTKHYQDKFFVVLLFGSVFTFFGILIPFDYITTAASHYGIDDSMANYLVSILNAASVISRISMGFIADKFGRFNVNTIGILCSGIGALAIWIPARGLAPYIVFAIIYGFSSGSFISVTPACVAEISDIRDIGTRIGVLFATGSFAVLVSIPISGAIIGDGSDDKRWMGTAVLAGLCILIGGGFVGAVRVLKVGWGFKKY